MEVTPLSVRGYAPSMKGGKEKRDPRHAHTEERRLPFFVSDFSCVTPPAPPKMMILSAPRRMISSDAAGLRVLGRVRRIGASIAAPNGPPHKASG